MKQQSMKMFSLNLHAILLLGTTLCVGCAPNKLHVIDPDLAYTKAGADDSAVDMLFTVSQSALSSRHDIWIHPTLIHEEAIPTSRHEMAKEFAQSLDQSAWRSGAIYGAGQ